MADLARQIPHHLDRPGGARLGSALLDLLTVAIGSRLDRCATLPPDVRNGALLTRVHSFIEARIGDPDLTPATVADVHHISVREYRETHRHHRPAATEG